MSKLFPLKNTNMNSYILNKYLYNKSIIRGRLEGRKSFLLLDNYDSYSSKHFKFSKQKKKGIRLGKSLKSRELRLRNRRNKDIQFKHNVLITKVRSKDFLQNYSRALTCLKKLGIESNMYAPVLRKQGKDFSILSGGLDITLFRLKLFHARLKYGSSQIKVLWAPGFRRYKFKRRFRLRRRLFFKKIDYLCLHNRRRNYLKLNKRLNIEKTKKILIEKTKKRLNLEKMKKIFKSAISRYRVFEEEIKRSGKKKMKRYSVIEEISKTVRENEKKVRKEKKNRSRLMEEINRTHRENEKRFLEELINRYGIKKTN